MNKKILIGIIALVLIGLGWFLFKSQAPTVDDFPMSDRQDRSDLGLSYKVPRGDEIRALEGGMQIGDTTMLGAIVLSSSTLGAPTISTFVFAESEEAKDETAVETGAVATSTPEATSTEDFDRDVVLTNWLTANDAITSYTTARGIEDVEVDGVRAIHYYATGTYQQDMYALRYQGRTFLIVGQYENAGDIYTERFDAYMNSLYLD